MQQSIEAFVADMSAQLDAVDSGLRFADNSSDILALRRILHLLHSLRESLEDENPARRREVSVALMAEFRQGLAAMAAGMAKAKLSMPAAPRGAAPRRADFAEGAVVPFSLARRRGSARAKPQMSPPDQNPVERIADLHFSRPCGDDLAGIRAEIDTIVDRRRDAVATQSVRPAKSAAKPGTKREPAVDPLHPIEMAWRMLPGIIRNLEQQLGKQITFVTAGGRIEVNRSLIDAIRVPLIYLTRNAADHGLETAQERVRAGKPPVGTIRIAVRREAGDVVVELSDDGRGLDAAKIAKLAAAGFVAGECAQGHADLGVASEQSSGTEGEARPALDRGIGLDAVRRHIEAAGGRVSLQSPIGRGVTATIRVPTEHARTSPASSDAERAVCLPNFPR